MEDTIHDRPSLSRSDAGRGSAAGSIALLTLFVGGLVAVSYPLLTAALAVGIVAGYFARHGILAGQRRIQGTVRTRETAGSSVGTVPPTR
ncbi:MAG: hypothetical protein ABEH88_08915 [Halobacteriales archaeon]